MTMAASLHAAIAGVPIKDVVRERDFILSHLAAKDAEIAELRATNELNLTAIHDLSEYVAQLNRTLGEKNKQLAAAKRETAGAWEQYSKVLAERDALKARIGVEEYRVAVRERDEARQELALLKQKDGQS